MKNAREKLHQLLNDEIVQFSIDDKSSYKHIADKIGDSRIVLLGEATHGTKEFYQARIELSKYLIEERNFQAITIEGDWPSAYSVNQYIKGQNNLTNAMSSLADFDRFPNWMWRNETMPAFIEWLRNVNEKKSFETKIGFYGLDLYCLDTSMQEVIHYLKKHDPEAAELAKQRYSCFDHMAIDPQKYGYLIESKLKKPCIKEALAQLAEMQELIRKKFSTDKESEELFSAMENALVVKNAEHYYRALFDSQEVTWNIRDGHMMETLQNLILHLEKKQSSPAKILVWAHNSHVGDARATEMSSRGEVNLGQLVREKFDKTSFHLGFSTYTGSVTAAVEWDGPAKNETVVPALVGSYEGLFHELELQNFYLDFHEGEHINYFLQIPRLQRAIGVIYRPETERMSHYFFSHLPHQFDAIIHLDETHAIQPLDTLQK